MYQVKSKDGIFSSGNMSESKARKYARDLNSNAKKHGWSQDYYVVKAKKLRRGLI